jgi:hypothetical protein
MSDWTLVALIVGVEALGLLVIWALCAIASRADHLCQDDDGFRR